MFPYTRGVHRDMYRKRLWTMRQFSGMGADIREVPFHGCHIRGRNGDRLRDALDGLQNIRLQRVQVLLIQQLQHPSQAGSVGADVPVGEGRAETVGRHRR